MHPQLAPRTETTRALPRTLVLERGQAAPDVHIVKPPCRPSTRSTRGANGKPRAWRGCGS